MGQKVHPTGARVGIIKDWNSKWYADSKDFANYLVEDQKIRKFLKKKFFNCIRAPGRQNPYREGN